MSALKLNRQLADPVALIRVGLAAAVVFVYLPVLENGFIELDDPAYVTQNSQVRQGLTRQGIAWAFSTFHAANWHPLTWISHMLDVTMFGLNPAGHHLASLLIHLFNALALFALLHAMTGAAARSGMVAALFAVHPLHVESVAWIAERKDVLSTAMALTALWCYVRYTRRPGPLPYLTSLFFFLLAVMAKPMPMTLPLILVVVDGWPLRRLWAGDLRKTKRIAVEKLPFLVMALLSGLVTVAAQSQGGAMGPLGVFPIWLRLANALWSCLSYIAKAIVPVNLAVYYPYDTRLMAAKAGLALVTLGCLTLMAWRMRHDRPYLLAGWLWYLIALLPVIGLVQVGSQAMADRYTYLPLTGVFVAGVWVAADWATRRKLKHLVRWGAALALIGLAAVMARQQVFAWKDTVTLFTKTLAVTDNNALAHNTMGLAHYRSGRFDKADGHFLQALAIDPGYAEAHINRGNLYLALNRYEEALACYQTALRNGSDLARAIYNIGLVEKHRGRHAQAKARFEQVLALDGRLGVAHTALAGIYLDQGRLGLAAAHCRQALAIDPTDARAHTLLGLVQEKTGDIQGAMAYYGLALKWAPESVEAHGNLGKLLLGQGQTETALSHFAMVVAIQPGSAVAHVNLAAALAAAGRLDQALAHCREALRLEPQSAKAHNAMGVVLARLNDTGAAIAHLRLALDLDPNDRDARENLDRLLHKHAE